MSAVFLLVIGKSAQTNSFTEFQRIANSVADGSVTKNLPEEVKKSPDNS